MMNEIEMLIIGLGILIVITILLLIKLYQLKIEKSLFSGRGEILNLINFIENARNKDVKDSEIRSSLRKAGWKRAQIGYVLKQVKVYK